MPDTEHRFAHEAMATTFEMWVWSADRDRAARAARSVFDLIDRLELDLTHYRADSDIGRLNAAAAGVPVKLGTDAFDCLQLARQAWVASDGMFDVTIGALYRAWRGEDETPREPTERDLKEALAGTGMQHLKLDPAGLTATKAVDGLRVSLGGIGKGYALDEAARLLREELELPRALLHSGHSTILAMDPPPNAAAWTVGRDGREVPLVNRSLSSSGTAVRGAHILNPKSGRPATGRQRVWAYASSGAISDAASTAAMLMDEVQCTAFTRAFPGTEFAF